MLEVVALSGGTVLRSFSGTRRHNLYACCHEVPSSQCGSLPYKGYVHVYTFKTLPNT
jgi:hypothetical protein